MDHRRGCNGIVSERARVLENEFCGLRASLCDWKHSCIQSAGLEERERGSKDMEYVMHMDRVALSFATIVATCVKQWRAEDTLYY